MIVSGGCEDVVFMKTIEITLNSIATSRDIFLNPLDEPYFWRTYFRKWVEEGVGEARKIQARDTRQEQE